MKTEFTHPARSRSAGNLFPKSGLIPARDSGFASDFGKAELPRSSSQNPANGTSYGAVARIGGQEPENDPRGLDTGYLRNEAGRSLWLGMGLLITAATTSFVCLWAASSGHFGSSLLLAVLACPLWRNCMSELSRCIRLNRMADDS